MIKPWRDVTEKDSTSTFRKSRKTVEEWSDNRKGTSARFMTSTNHNSPRVNYYKNNTYSTPKLIAIYDIRSRKSKRRDDTLENLS